MTAPRPFDSGVSGIFQTVMVHWTEGVLRLPNRILVGVALLFAGPVFAQAPPGAVTVTLHNAMERARQYGTQIQSASLTAALAKEDSVQARAARLPSASILNQAIYTQGNGTPSGVFIANNGVHEYGEQVAGHQDLLALIRRGDINRTRAAEAVARARSEVAARGLNATVLQDYYAIVAATRRLLNAQTSLTEASRFLDLTQKQEAGGEVARADVVKARITVQQRQREREEAQLAIDKATIALGVLIFPDLRSDFAVEDDIPVPVQLPLFTEAEAKATDSSPDLKAARAGILEAGYGVQVARYLWLPALNVDVLYGINANQLAFRTTEDQRNLGYAAQVSLNIPVWNWGATRSKIRQSEIRRQQAELDLTLTQRTLRGTLATAYKEAQTAQAQLDSLRSSAELSAESLRLTLLRYQAGESIALEVVDAQNTATLARNALDDGEVRSRLAAVNLQLLTGTF